MVDHGARGVFTRPTLVIGAVALGAVTAGIGVVPAASASPTDGYPSWADVQRSKHDTKAAEAEVKTIVGLIGTLQTAADKAERTAQLAAEKAHEADAARDAAAQRLSGLTTQTAAAEQKARVSRMRAGLLAAHLARSGGGGQLPLDLALNGDHATDLLHQLATASQLSAQSASIYRSATVDENTAAALAGQAKVANGELASLAAAAKKASADAADASDAAAAAVTKQQAELGRLMKQLASLRNTSQKLATKYVDGLEAARERAAAAAAAAAADGGGGTVSYSVPDPNASKAERVVDFAREQIGKPYVFGGAGPSVWDCSGLTLMAYASIGISIGQHGVTSQYDRAKAQGLLVPVSQVQAGDLVFYASGGAFYHVAIASGDGNMIEAPHAGADVREVPIRGMDLVAFAARFTG